MMILEKLGESKKNAGQSAFYYIYKSYARIRHAGYGLISYIFCRVVRGVITEDAFLALVNFDEGEF